jgi:hypothetical protein
MQCFLFAQWTYNSVHKEHSNVKNFVNMVISTSLSYLHYEQVPSLSSCWLLGVRFIPSLANCSVTPSILIYSKYSYIIQGIQRPLCLLHRGVYHLRYTSCPFFALVILEIGSHFFCSGRSELLSYFTLLTIPQMTGMQPSFFPLRWGLTNFFAMAGLEP